MSPEQDKKQEHEWFEVELEVCHPKSIAGSTDGKAQEWDHYVQNPSKTKDGHKNDEPIRVYVDEKKDDGTEVPAGEAGEAKGTGKQVFLHYDPRHNAGRSVIAKWRAVEEEKKEK